MNSDGTGSIAARIGIGIHMTSDRFDYALDDVYDFFCFQCKTTLATAEVARKVRDCIAKVGKPVNAFEVAWDADKARAKAMLDAGAFGVGIW